jgi:DNA-binding NtrC family response regulator
MNAAKQNPRTASEMPRPSKSERILVVKEEKTIRETIASMLTRAGYECQGTGDGLEALAMLDSSKGFDLLLAGLSLDMLGHTKAKYPDLPVVIVAVHSVPLAWFAVQSGAYEYLFKPFEEEQLLATVRRALEYRRLKLANRDYEKKLGTLKIPTAYESERILVQHNEETIREIVSSMLGGARNCRVATSPTEAWGILSAGEAVALLLCKVVESLEEGLIERVVERFPDVPVIVWGNRPIPMFLEAVRKGAYDYLPLPFEREQLLVIVRRALEYRCLKLENREYKARLEKLAKKESHG